MNRIFLIGNGFDLQHKLNTKYTDFINDYWKNAIADIIKNGQNNSFSNSEFKIEHPLGPLFNQIQSVKTYSDLKVLLASKGREFDIKFSNSFLSALMSKIDLDGWVNAEKVYYNELKKILMNINAQQNDKRVKELNEDFEAIKMKLKHYLIKEQDSQSINATDFHRIQVNISEILYQKIDKSIWSQEYKKSKYFATSWSSLDDSAIRYPNSCLFLNFNYTDTDKTYYDNVNFKGLLLNRSIQPKAIYIHGNLLDEKNPIIFGYGDELDESYLEIERLENNHFLENIKSIKYLETRNYDKFLTFINSDYYEVFVLGHSCGNSDRTLLNLLFESDYCAAIRIVYKKNEDGSDNFSDIARNISRNFKDKLKMRDRLVNKEDSIIF